MSIRGILLILTILTISTSCVETSNDEDTLSNGVLIVEEKEIGSESISDANSNGLKDSGNNNIDAMDVVVNETTDTSLNIELIDALKVIINDDIWFWKDYSKYVDMIDRDIVIHIYSDDNDNHMMFLDYLTSQERDKPFVVVKIIPFNGSYSTSAEEVMYVTNQSELRNMISPLGFKKNGSTSIYIKSPVEPNYDSSNEDRDVLIAQIIELVIKDTKSRYTLPVTHNVEVTNFRDSDSQVIVLKELEDGELSYVVFKLNDELSFGVVYDHMNIGHVEAYHNNKGEFIIYEEEIHIEAPSKFSDSEPVISDFHPVLIRNQLVIGSDDENWYSLDDFIQVEVSMDESKEISNNMISGTETYKYYYGNERIAYISTSGMVAYEEEATGDTITGFSTEPYSSHGIGINCDWDPLPRKLFEISPSLYRVDIDDDEHIDEIRIIKSDLKGDPYKWDIVIDTYYSSYVAATIDITENDENQPNVAVNALDLNGDNRMELIFGFDVSYGSGYLIIECFDNHANVLYKHYSGN